MPRPKFICQHKSSEYSPLEKTFIDIIKSDKELETLAKQLNLLHEWKISGKTEVKGKTKDFRYWADFYVPKKAVDIEINHDGHRKGGWYMPSQGIDVYSKDKIRKRRLEQRGIKVKAIYEERLTRGWILRMLKEISQMPDVTTLDMYVHPDHAHPDRP
jgi:hypothetical protein